MGKMDIWGKRVGYPSSLKGTLSALCPFPQMFAYGHRGKWALGRLGQRGTLGALAGYHKCCVLIKSPKFFENGQWGKWAFEGRGYPKWPKRVHQIPCAHSPKIFANGQREKLALGVLGKR